MVDVSVFVCGNGGRERLLCGLDEVASAPLASQTQDVKCTPIVCESQ